MGDDFFLDDDRSMPPTRVILVHGFNGEPLDMAELDDYLVVMGFRTSNLLLPGHRVSLRAFAEARWEHWLDAVRARVREAVDAGERVLLIGHSLGGALVLATSALEPEVDGVIALCPPISMSPTVRRTVNHLHPYVPFVPSFGEDVRDRIGVWRRYHRRAYLAVALRTAHSLMESLPAVRGLLPRVSVPALVVAARHDHVVPVGDGIEAYKLLGSREKRLVVLEKSYHVVTKDVERHVVFEYCGDFCMRQARRSLLPKAAEASQRVTPSL
ncbi:MAG TPA: alpha/beta fold hydrolase [Ktedonobacterales bacterium]